MDYKQLSSKKLLLFPLSSLPSEYPQAVTWSIADPEIASIDQNGIITGLKLGITQVIVKSTVDEKHL